MRKIREQNKIKEKIDIRQKMYEIQLKNLNDKVDNEESRIQQQVDLPILLQLILN